MDAGAEQKQVIVSSPLATGGAGQEFERHVGAAYLALLLVRGMMPIHKACQIEEVSFQTNHLGWHTDDLLLMGRDTTGERKLALQVKRKFTVSATDDDSVKAVGDFWQDYCSQHFVPDRDALVLVVRQGTDSLLGSFRTLLEQARAANDWNDFRQRLEAPGLIPKSAKAQREAVRAIIAATQKSDVPDDDVYRFLRSLHVISLDLCGTASQTASSMTTLLAQASREAAPPVAAENAWNRLLELAGSAAPSARTFRRDDLPDELLREFSAVSNQDEDEVRRLEEHGDTVLRHIECNLRDGQHIDRRQLVGAVIDAMQTGQVVLLTGVAGQGKSAVARSAAAHFQGNSFVTAFRAEEFAKPHLDAMLNECQCGFGSERLFAHLSLRGQKICIVESLERLLESTTREAFGDFLRFVARDRTWSMIVTCREHAVQLVREAFFEPAGLQINVLQVPALTDDELSAVAITAPALAIPLGRPPLRKLLSNVYVLSFASVMNWQSPEALPLDATGFRDRFWREIVRRDSHSADGMPRRREQTFRELCVRRARALTMHVACEGLDNDALARLQDDSLVQPAGWSDRFVTPMHDVLEDWALVRWIDEEWQASSEQVSMLVNCIAGYPALRRAYRLWLNEQLVREVTGADSLVQATLADYETPPYFRDDTLASIVTSPHAAAFFARQAPWLLSNDSANLCRVLHLIRVACKACPSWTPQDHPLSLAFQKPEGPVWASALEFVAANAVQLVKRHATAMLAFLEDWARGVSLETPYPAGAQAAAAIAFQLLPEFDEYSNREELQRTLKIIVAIPNACPDQFGTICNRATVRPRRDRLSDSLAELLLEDLSLAAAARDFPEAVMALAYSEWLPLPVEVDTERRWPRRNEVEDAFGLASSLQMAFSPASALQGPFFQLLRFHPDKGIRFVVDFVNHCADWYGSQRTPAQFVEPPHRIDVRFADGATSQQWCNPRLWQLYRGTSVGPNILQSALMALEHWLLDYARHYPEQVDLVLLAVLNRSNNVALSAVVASVATAYPQLAVPTSLTLLGNREFVRLDKVRLVAESQVLSRMNLSHRSDDQLFEGERRKSDALPHRRHDLEWLAFCLQETELCREPLQRLLDQHRQQNPPLDQQSQQDKEWRIALDRMDARKYVVDEDAAALLTAGDDASAEAIGQDNVVVKRLAGVAPDLQAMSIEAESVVIANNQTAGIFMWARKNFEKGPSEERHSHLWYDYLQMAQRPGPDPRTVVPGLWNDGATLTAVVCVRDQWDKLSSDERSWCVATICGVIEAQQVTPGDELALCRNAMHSSRPAAIMLALLLEKELSPDERQRVEQCLAFGLTHPNQELAEYTAVGVGRYLWKSDTGLAGLCVGHLWNRLIAMDREVDLRRSKRQLGYGALEQLSTELSERCRGAILARTALPVLPQDSAVAVGPEAAYEISAALYALEGGLGSPLCATVLTTVINTLLRYARGRQQDDDRYPVQAVPAWEDRVAAYLLRMSAKDCLRYIQPIVDLDARHDGHFLPSFLRQFIRVADSSSNAGPFWDVWQAFADRVTGSIWAQSQNPGEPRERELIGALFLRVGWNRGTKEWPKLAGEEHRVLNLFQSLPPVQDVVEDFVLFLYDVGTPLMPGAFVELSRRLEQGDHQEMLAGKNSQFCLEAMLKRFVYGQPNVLKSNAGLRAAVLHLLDVLVECGSSAAYQMRDDFVTPLAGQVSTSE